MNEPVTDGPLVSIYMPVYNEERFIRVALGSLLDQTYRNIEILLSGRLSSNSQLAISG